MEKDSFHRNACEDLQNTNRRDIEWARKANVENRLLHLYTKKKKIEFFLNVVPRAFQPERGRDGQKSIRNEVDSSCD